MNHDYEKFCTSCGASIDKRAQYCPKCGAKQVTDFNNQTNTMNDNQEKIGTVNKQWLITIILCVLVGEIGVHRFYNGKITSGIFELLTFGGFGIWYLIDIITIVLEKFTDKDGNYIKIN